MKKMIELDDDERSFLADHVWFQREYLRLDRMIVEMHHAEKALKEIDGELAWYDTLYNKLQNVDSEVEQKS